MDNNKYQSGLEVMHKLAGEHGKQALAGVESFSPEFARLLVESFGATYGRTVFDFKQRELITLSSLITQGASDNQLGFHLISAIDAGFTKEELIEVIIHCSAYAGFPKAVNAFLLLQKIFEARNESDPSVEG